MKTAPFLQTAHRKYSRYSRHVLGFRHFPEGRDGLLPVRRRALWAMHKLGTADKSHMTVTAKIVGETIGNFHPHDGSAVASSIEEMSQQSASYPLVMGVGQWGDHDQGAGAIRYTKAYLSKYATSMFDLDEMACVPLDPTYSGKGIEPRFLPVRLPHLLLGGCESLAPGYRGNIPPCNADWVAESVRKVMVGSAIKPPIGFAYRWGGRLRLLEKSWVKTGAGRAVFSPTMTLENGAIVLHSLAPHLSLASIDRKIEDDPAFAGMAEEAPTKGPMRILIRVKRGHKALDFAKRIRAVCTVSSHYSFLRIEQTGPIGDDLFDPHIEGPQAFLRYWVDWRRTIVANAAKHRIAKLNAEISRIDLMLKVIGLIDQLWLINKQSKDRSEIRMRVIKLLKCSNDEATMVMDIPWTRLATLEVPPLKKRRKECEDDVRKNQVIVRKPDAKMEADIQSTLIAIQETAKEAAQLRSVGKGKK
jgi:DNA gyrase/topoisomerase IV subunit A